MEIYSLKCKLCNGIMAVDKSKKIIACPYCGSKELIVESDAVKIEEIKAYADIEKHKDDNQLELAKHLEHEKNSTIFLIALMIFVLVIWFVGMISSYIL